MQNFIVLGLVPGTQIQLTFTFWVIIASVVFGLPLLYIFMRATIAAARSCAQAFSTAEFILPQ